LIKFYEETRNISEEFLFHNIIIDLVNAKKGLENLKKTYINDIKFICDLDVIIQMIDLKLCYHKKDEGHFDGTAPISNNETIE
jgi:hypothetical protein